MSSKEEILLNVIIDNCVVDVDGDDYVFTYSINGKSYQLRIIEDDFLSWFKKNSINIE